jgi:3-oxoacyl-[acyl-carrier-protein] synthase II
MSSLSPGLIIRGLSTISAVGATSDDWRAALALERAPVDRPHTLNSRPVFPLAQTLEASVSAVRQEHAFEKLDRAALLALVAAQRTLESLTHDHKPGCIAIGSSRGPTGAIEKTLAAFKSGEARVPPLTSPVTTAGNLSAWVAQAYLARRGDELPSTPLASISTSMTCSSAFHSLLVARSFVLSGMAECALFGGTEACLTPYSVAQFEALRIYSAGEGAWPCTPLSAELNEANSVAIGEGAGVALLTPDDGIAQPGDLRLLGVGWALERIPSATGISDDGQAFERAMGMAASQLGPLGIRGVDAVIAHAPGSRKGDQAECKAIQRVFPGATLCSTKHLTGHTYGASGMLSLELARYLLQGGEWPGLPYPSASRRYDSSPGAISVVAVNTAGFGGNAITLIVGVPAAA